MGYVEEEEFEYMFKWVDESTVRVSHFLVKGGFNQGSGTKGMHEILAHFETQGATKIVINMGGGERTENWLRDKFNFTILSVGSYDEHENPPVTAVKDLSPD